MAVDMTPAGWYPDNRDAALLRWWDGVQWTAYTQPRPAAVPVQPAFQAGGAASSAAEAVAEEPAAARHTREPSSKRDLHAEVDRLRQALNSMGFAERDQLSADITRMREEVARLRREEAQLSDAVVPLRAEMAAWSSERATSASLHAEVQQLQQQRDALTRETANLRQLLTQLPALKAEHAQLSSQLIETRETMILQEAGVYQYRHPLDDALAYKAKLIGLQARIKDAVRAGTAVRGATNWTVNDPEGSSDLP